MQGKSLIKVEEEVGWGFQKEQGPFSSVKKHQFDAHTFRLKHFDGTDLSTSRF